MRDAAGNLLVANDKQQLECFSPQGDTLWTKSFTGQVQTNGITQDVNGNYYFTGVFSGSATFGKDRLTAGPGQSDIFISKLDPSRNFVWTKQISATSTSAGRFLTADSNGHIYVGSTFNGDVTIGTTTLHSAGETDILVAELDQSGNIQWVKSFGGSSYDGLYGMTWQNNKITLIGAYSFNFNCGTIHLTGASTASSFLASISSDGTPAWAKGYDNCTIYGLNVNSNGKIYITGGVRGRVNFGAGQTLSTTNTYDDVFLAQLANDGSPEWLAKCADATYFNSGQSILTDAKGDVYVAGSFSNTLHFGTLKAISHGEDDLFILKYSANGQPIWLKGYGGPGEDGAGNMVFSKDGNHLYIAGFLQDGPIQMDNTTLEGDGSGASFIGSISGRLTAIDEPESTELSFNLYPNPASGVVNIELPQALRQDLIVRVSDLCGRTVSENVIHAGASRLQLDHLTAGIYLINTPGSQNAVKLIVY
jgi:hypothetical protein